MKRLKLYKITISYMLLYIVAILFTGVWLFLLSQGLASTDLATIFTQIVDKPIAKSIHSYVEVATPHMFAIGVLIFLVAHFMLFSTKISQKFSSRVSVTLYVLALINILAYLLIMFGFVTSGWIKLVFMGLFVLVFLFLLAMLAFSL